MIRALLAQSQLFGSGLDSGFLCLLPAQDLPFILSQFYTLQFRQTGAIDGHLPIRSEI